MLSSLDLHSIQPTSVNSGEQVKRKHKDFLDDKRIFY